MVVLQCSSNEPTKASELCCLVFFFGRLQTPSFRMLVERRVGGRSRMVFDVSNWRRLTPNSGDLVFRRAETRAPNVATRNTDHARNVHRTAMQVAIQVLLETFTSRMPTSFEMATSSFTARARWLLGMWRSCQCLAIALIRTSS